MIYSPKSLIRMRAFKISTQKPINKTLLIIKLAYHQTCLQLNLHYKGQYGKHKPTFSVHDPAEEEGSYHISDHSPVGQPGDSKRVVVKPRFGGVRQRTPRVPHQVLIEARDGEKKKNKPAPFVDLWHDIADQ